MKIKPMKPTANGGIVCLFIHDVIKYGIVDCLGGTDERQICQSHNSHYSDLKYQCWNTSRCLTSFYTVCNSVDN